MTFERLMRYMERVLGHHQVPLRAHAARLADLFESCALHHELMLRLANSVYKENRCTKLSDPIDRTTTLNALGPIRRDVLRAPHTDVDAYNFIESLCAAVCDAFEREEPHTPPVVPAPQPGRVLAFPGALPRVKTLA